MAQQLPGKLGLTCLQCLVPMVMIEEDESGDAIGIYQCPKCKVKVDTYLD